MDIMETITEKEPLDETLALDGEEEKEDIEDAKLLAPEENVSSKLKLADCIKWEIRVRCLGRFKSSSFMVKAANQIFNLLAVLRQSL